LIISGAFGLFRKEQVIKVGGYARDTVGEDFEMILKLRSQSYLDKNPQTVAFIPVPVVLTEAPETFISLGAQRDRWHRGLTDVLWRYRRVMLNPRFGVMGLVAYPYFFFVEMLAPVVEIVGLVVLGIGLALGVVDVSFAALFFLAAYGYGLVLTLVTLVIDEVVYHRYETASDRLLLILWAVAENFGYRQLTVYWRLRGMVKFLRERGGWGTMKHQGFGPSPDTPTN